MKNLKNREEKIVTKTQNGKKYSDLSRFFDNLPELLMNSCILEMYPCMPNAHAKNSYKEMHFVFKDTSHEI